MVDVVVMSSMYGQFRVSSQVFSVSPGLVPILGSCGGILEDGAGRQRVVERHDDRRPTDSRRHGMAAWNRARVCRGNEGKKCAYGSLEDSPHDTQFLYSTNVHLQSLRYPQNDVIAILVDQRRF